MISFVKKIELTGCEKKLKKDGTSYFMVYAMGENGQTIACKYSGDKNLDDFKRGQFEVHFNYFGGQYPRMEILSF